MSVPIGQIICFLGVNDQYHRGSISCLFPQNQLNSTRVIALDLYLGKYTAKTIFSFCVTRETRQTQRNHISVGVVVKAA